VLSGPRTRLFALSRSSTYGSRSAHPEHTVELAPPGAGASTSAACAGGEGVLALSPSSPAPRETTGSRRRTLQDQPKREDEHRPLLHRQFMVESAIDGASQDRAAGLAIAKSQAALDYYSLLEHNQHRRDVCASVASSQETQRQDAEGLAVFEGEELTCTVDRYVRRIIKYSRCSECNVVIGCLYLERIKKEHPELELTPFNLQRLMLCACMVAAKVFDDVYYNNRHWAEIGELGVKETNDIELKFLSALDFNCHVKREEYNEFVASLETCSRLLRSPLDKKRRPPPVQIKRLSVSAQHTPISPSASKSTSPSGRWASSPSGRSHASTEGYGPVKPLDSKLSAESTPCATTPRATASRLASVSTRSSGRLSPPRESRASQGARGRTKPTTNLDGMPAQSGGSGDGPDSGEGHPQGNARGAQTHDSLAVEPRQGLRAKVFSRWG